MDGTSTGTTAGVATEFARLEERKRRVYTIASVAGIAVIAISWLARTPGDLILEVIYPLLAVALAAFAHAMHRRWLRLDLLEHLALATVGLVILGRLAWHLHLAGPIDEHLLILTGAHYWSVGALIVAGFVLLDRRRGLWVGIGVLTVSVVLVATGAGPELVGPDGSELALLYLIRVHGFLVLLLVLVTAVATLREQLHRELTRSEALHELATTDPLTGLANRRATMDALEREVESARRYGRPVSVIAADVDRFKRINDEHGHHVGDQVLTEVARRLAGEARQVDVVSRWGGEEFLIVLPQTRRGEAARLAERTRRALATSRPGGVEVTATFGVAELREGESVDDLLVRADRLLYRAKRDGRDQVGSEPLPG